MQEEHSALRTKIMDVLRYRPVSISKAAREMDLTNVTLNNFVRHRTRLALATQFKIEKWLESNNTIKEQDGNK